MYEETRSAKFEETRSGNVDFRIQGLPHSTVQKEGYDCREMVTELIHQFDTHLNRDSLMEDLNKTEEFNQFSQKSKELISSKDNTEYFELCEISSKIQCPDGSLYWDVGIVYCTCGKCVQPSERNRQLNKNRYDVLSICGYVIKKNPSHGATDQLCGRKSTTKHTTCPRKPRRNSPVLFWKGGTQTISSEVLCLKLGRMKNHDGLRQIASQDHSYIATREERSLNENSWKLSLNAEGANGPLDQRDDINDARGTCKTLYHEHTASTGCANMPILPQQEVRQRPNQQFERHEEYSYGLDSSG